MIRFLKDAGAIDVTCQNSSVKQFANGFKFADISNSPRSVAK
jgi:hypothetical protein